MRNVWHPTADESHPRRYLVCYDIPDDARRAVVARVLTGFGTRVQFSVFECCLTLRELRRLVRALSDSVDSASDELRIHGLGDATVASPPVDTGAAFWLF